MKSKEMNFRHDFIKKSVATAAALGDFGCHDMNSTTWAFNLHTSHHCENLPVIPMEF